MIHRRRCLAWPSGRSLELHGQALDQPHRIHRPPNMDPTRIQNVMSHLVLDDRTVELLDMSLQVCFHVTQPLALTVQLTVGCAHRNRSRPAVRVPQPHPIRIGRHVFQDPLQIR